MQFGNEAEAKVAASTIVAFEVMRELEDTPFFQVLTHVLLTRVSTMY